MRLYPSDDLPELHTYGSGPEQDEIKAEAEGLPGVQVNGGIDHAHPSRLLAPKPLSTLVCCMPLSTTNTIAFEFCSR